MNRRGFTVWEILAASVLLGALTTFCLQFIHAAASQRQASQARLAALQEASNTLEQLYALGWDELTPEAARRAETSRHLAKIIPGGELEVVIDGPSGTPPAKRIAVLVRWRIDNQRPAEPVRLVAWRYRKT
jgi:hypothetical protein